ncbi:MAG: amidohydrolase [Clostridiales bacterium]|nr:amidohydrolase [Clostridiales bacterium]
MDKIFLNGTIRTMDPSVPKAQAVAVKNGLIIRIGKDEEILRLQTSDTQLIDLKGRLLLPGFNDSHIHLLSYGYSLEKVNVGKARSIDDLIAEGRNFLKEHPDTRWMQGRGWNNEDWDDKKYPTRYDLDRISTEIPISFVRTCAHVIVVNSKALEIMGIGKDPRQVEGGKIDIDRHGEPLGIFQEEARQIVYDAVPSLTECDIRRMIRNGARKLLECGITSVQSDDLEAVAASEYQKVLDVYFKMAEERSLPVRVYQQCLLPPLTRLREFFALGYHWGQGNDLFRIGPLKLLGDGSLGGRTAYMAEPYADDPSTRGIRIFSQEELDELIAFAHDRDMPCAVHCIGDGQLYMAFDAIEKAMLRNPKPDMRHSLVHCQITDAPLLKKFRDLKVIAHIQPIFLNTDIAIVEARVGKEKARTSYNWRTMADTGVLYACGSDAPVEHFDVMKNIYCAVTRKTLAGDPPEGWYPEQRLTVEQAVRGFTINGAYASGEETLKGSIVPGKYADFVLLERDIFAIAPREIKEVDVLMTVLGGEIVYEK